MIYSFLDIAIQIICQIPLYHDQEILKFLGFSKVYMLNKNVDQFKDLFGANAPSLTIVDSE